jgi:hypothetical protein
MRTEALAVMLFSKVCDADILSREVIQNSWDSALKVRESHGDHGIEFRMNFDFKELKGAEKKKFVKNAALLDFEFPLKSLPKGDPYKERFESELKALNSDEPLRLLYCSDFGGHGLYGHPSKLKESILYRALYYLGGAAKQQGVAGGNFGFGKGAFVKGSKLHVVFAYSTFDKWQGDKVQRRLVGCSFWDQFGDAFDGRGRFGVRTQDGPGGDQKIVPYEQVEAEKMAQLLGFPERGIGGPDDFGASFLLISPSVTPSDLKDSIERNWWPAIEQKELRFNVQITDLDGRRIHMRPRENPVAKHFVSSFFSALDAKSEIRDQSSLVVEISNVQREKHGTLCAKVISEEVPEDLEDDKGNHLVLGRIALVRRPRMVVSYQHHEIKRSKICGVFVAEDKYDKALQATEPSLHYQWATEPSEDIKTENTNVARTVMRGIRSQLKKWLEVLTPPPPREDTYLRKFAELLSPFMKGLNPNPPPPPPPPVYEPVNFRFLSGPEPAVARDDRVQTEAVFSVKLSDQAEDDRLEVIVGTEFQITEDDRDSGDSWGYSLTVVGKDSGAVREGNNWRLMLVKDREVKFSFKSDPYSSNYTGRLKKFAILEDVIKGN